MSWRVVMCVVDRGSVKRTEVFRRTAALSLDWSFCWVVAVRQVEIWATGECGKRWVSAILWQAKQSILVSIVVILKRHKLAFRVVVLNLRMIIDETLLKTQQPAHQIGAQVVGHAVVKHEFLLIAIARWEIQLATEDCRKNVKLLGVWWDGTEAQRRRRVVHQTAAASGCTILFKIQRERYGNPECLKYRGARGNDCGTDGGREKIYFLCFVHFRNFPENSTKKNSLSRVLFTPKFYISLIVCLTKTSFKRSQRPVNVNLI